jgi:hypothetical protein
MIYYQSKDSKNVDTLYSIIQILRSQATDSGVYAVIHKKTDKAKSFPFTSEHSGLFYLRLEKMSAKHVETQSGYELRHQRLEHASFQNIRDTLKLE